MGYPCTSLSLAVLKQEDVYATDEDCHRHCCHGLPHMHRGHTSQTKSRSLESAEDLLQATSTMFTASRVHLSPFSPLNTHPMSHISTLGKSVQINATAVATSGPNAHHHKPTWTGKAVPTCSCHAGRAPALCPWYNLVFFFFFFGKRYIRYTSNRIANRMLHSEWNYISPI